MRRAPSFHKRIFPSRSLPITEYSVEDSRMLLTNSTACCAVARIELSKSAGFIATSCQIAARKRRNLRMKIGWISDNDAVHRSRTRHFARTPEKRAQRAPFGDRLWE